MKIKKNTNRLSNFYFKNFFPFYIRYFFGAQKNNFLCMGIIFFQTVHSFTKINKIQKTIFLPKKFLKKSIIFEIFFYQKNVKFF